LDPESASDLGQLDLAAIDRVRNEACPTIGNSNELYDALTSLGCMSEQNEIDPAWRNWFDELVAKGRAARLSLNHSERNFWVCAENLPMLRVVYPEHRLFPIRPVPGSGSTIPENRETAVTELVRTRLYTAGPITADTLSNRLALDVHEIEKALLQLESEGFLLRGKFTPGSTLIEWCERGLLARIHRYTIKKLRREIEAVTTAEYFHFLFHWQHVHPNRQMQGADALGYLVQLLEGFEAASISWEADILPARIKHYNPEWLDGLCSSGKTIWSRFSPPSSGTAPIKSTPITLLPRKGLAQWRILTAHKTNLAFSGIAEKVKRTLELRGALFFEELLDHTGLLCSQLESALAELVTKGLVSADSFSGLRALLVPDRKRRGKLKPLFRLDDVGRWTLIHPANANLQHPESDSETKCSAVEYFANVLLRRYGVIFQALLTRETLSPAWSEILPVLRRMEARGELRGGRFVAGHSGEQFARPDAIESLRKLRKDEKDKEYISISAADPLNLIGIITPGKKISALANNRILFQDGIPIAVLSGKEVQHLHAVEKSQQWELKQCLIRRAVTPVLRSYIGG